MRPERTSIASYYWIGVFPDGEAVVALELPKGIRLLSAIPVGIVTGQDPEVAAHKSEATAQSPISRKP